MKKYFLALFTTLLFASLGFAQEEDVHSDIEFGYDNFQSPNSIVVESDELTFEGIQVAEGGFTQLFGDIFADNPGFITAIDEGLRVNAGDEISIRFLNAGTDTSVGTGFVNYYNPTTQLLQDDFGQVEISNQGGDAIVLNGVNAVGGADSLLLSVGSDGIDDVSNAPEEDENRALVEGEIHNHIIFDLQGAEDVGAYGLLFQLEADFNGTTGPDGVIDVTSAPIWLVHNNGLDEEVFENQALAAFGVGTTAVPEPTTGVVVMATATAILTRRRRRR